jgi:hypothetical protein
VDAIDDVSVLVNSGADVDIDVADESEDEDTDADVLNKADVVVDAAEEVVDVESVDVVEAVGSEVDVLV